MMGGLAASAIAGYAGLAIFVTFFALVIATLLRPGAKESGDRHAQIPFKED